MQPTTARCAAMPPPADVSMTGGWLSFIRPDPPRTELHIGSLFLRSPATRCRRRTSQAPAPGPARESRTGTKVVHRPH
jgi:hypothetical protein